MSKRPPNARTQAEATTLSLPALNSEIERCLIMLGISGSSQGRKAFFDRLIRCEKVREEVYGVPAPARRFRRGPMLQSN